MTNDNKEDITLYLFFAYIIALIVIVVGTVNWAIHCRAWGCNNDRPSLEVKYCYDHRCREHGCYEYKEAENDYCKAHQEIKDAEWKAHMEELAKLPVCQYPKCEEKVCSSGKIYCVLHYCLVDGCNNPNAGGYYCKTHQCPVRGCYKKAGNHSHDTDNKKDTSKDTSQKSSGSKPKTKQKKTYPDCDDYDDYDDFMDDWDGYMPNGEDAEDYWEDW